MWVFSRLGESIKANKKCPYSAMLASYMRSAYVKFKLSWFQTEGGDKVMEQMGHAAGAIFHRH